MGDTCDSQNIAQLARNPDVLVHEATNENSHEEKCVQNGHSTPSKVICQLCLMRQLWAKLSKN